MDLTHLRVSQGKKLDVSTLATTCTEMSEREALERIKKNGKKLHDFQDRLYGESRRGVLIVFQAMDAAGKDSTIKHVFGGINPQGCNVYSFKGPTDRERSHDFLWRCNLAVPPQGMMHIFNRSHYEEVLVTRVHPEYILGQGIHGVKDVADIDEAFWKDRFERIKAFEHNLAKKGTIVLKFFLNVSKEEQLNRFNRRLDRPDKTWKYSIGDVKERLLWDKYMDAYNEALPATSTDEAPWYIIPADSKPVMRAMVSEIIKDTVKDLDVNYPDFDGDIEALKAEQKRLLENES